MEIVKEDSYEEDLKNLFVYFSGHSYFLEIVKFSGFVTNIETSGLFSEDEVKILKKILKEKSKDGMISYEEFKSIWTTKLDSRPSVKDVIKHFITLIDEMLIINGDFPIDKDEFNLDRDIMANIILGLEMASTEGDAIQLAEDLVKSIDSNLDGKVSLKDFEFLQEEYLNSMTEIRKK